MGCCNASEININIGKKYNIIQDAKLPRIASFLLRPIADFCNLDCSYCYYKTHKKTVSWDSDLTIKIMYDIIRYVKETQYSVKLCWHGGEPMLAGLDFYKEAVYSTNIFMQKYDIPKHRIQHTIQTNATLINQKWCDFFKENNFGVGISFDIIKDVQNKERSNSYKKIIKAIELLQNNNISFGINTVCSEALLLHNPEDIFNQIVHLKLKNLEFSQMSQKDRDNEKYNQMYAKFMISMIDVYLQYNNKDISFRFFDSAIKELLAKQGSLCTHNKKHCGNYPTIDAYGNFHFCDNYDEKEYNVKEVANLKEISLIEAVKIASYQEIREQPRLYSSDCKTCDVSDLCQGGCPGNFDHKLQHNIFCSAYKQIFRHIKNTVGETVNYLKING